MSAVDVVLEAGFSKPITRLALADKDEVIHLLALYHAILKCKAELDDLPNGLGALWVSSMITSHPELLQPFLHPQGF